MIRLGFAIPGDLASPTGGYGYDRAVMERLPGHGFDLTHLALPGGFPFPSSSELQETARQLAAFPAGGLLLVDGLAFGAIPEAMLAAIAAPMAVLLHHPLGLETGLAPEASAALIASERAALRHARHVIVTSRTTAETLAQLGFAPPPAVTIAEPGTEPAPRAAPADGTVEILSVGAVVPRKGHDLLIEALAGLADLDWRCTIAGSLDRDSTFAAGILRRIEEAGLQDRIRLTGPLRTDELQRHYAAAHLFALPSRYEGYGMAFSEAMARGLPVIAARAGAVPGTVPSDAGILVPPDDVPALREALGKVIADAAMRQRMSDAAWAHGQTLPRWSDTAGIIADVLKEIAR